MLLETSGSSSYHDEEKLNDFLEKSFNSGVILDGTLTGEPSKIKVKISFFFLLLNISGVIW